MALMKCPECGNSVSDMADKCTNCGFPVYMKMNRSTKKKKCSYCGGYSATYEEICPSCCARFEETDIVEKELQSTENVSLQKEEFQEENVKLKNKWIGLALCYFLGMFGAHKFYEGNKKTGKLYLFTFGLFGLGWMFDMISYLLKPETLYNPNAPSEQEKKRKKIALVITIILVSIAAFMNEEESKTDTEEGTEVSTQSENEVFLF